jgi:hypothetical protein
MKRITNFWKVGLKFKAFYFKNAQNTEGVLLELILNFPKGKLLIENLQALIINKLRRLIS